VSVIEDCWTGSLKVACTLVLTATLRAVAPGDVVAVGGVTSAAGE